MKATQKLSFLRRYALRKESPPVLKELAKMLRDEEKLLKEHKRSLKSELKDNKELIDSIKKSKRMVNKHHQKVFDAQNTLLGYPLLEIPSKDIVRYNQ
jgi:hypothetical protein